MLTILLAVVHVNAYVFPHSILIRHLVLLGYLAYGAYQYRKFMHWDYKKTERRAMSRDTRVPADIYGRIRAEELIKTHDCSLNELLKLTPTNSPEFITGYKTRIQEEIDKGGVKVSTGD
jgi:hypothetical protein